MNKILPHLEMVDDLKYNKRKLITIFALALLIFYVASVVINLIDLPFIITIFADKILDVILSSDISNGIQIDSSIFQDFRIPVWHTILSLFLFAGLTIIVIIFRKYVDQGTCKSLGLKKKGFFKHYILGFGVGTIVILASFGLDYLFGSVSNIRLSQVSVGSVVLIVVYFFGFLVQSMAEEVLCRGYLLTGIAYKHTAVKAIILSSVFFALLHIENPGYGLLTLLSIFIFGLDMALFVYITGDIWAACGIHCAWNFIQTNIISSSNPSLFLSNDPTVFVFDVSDVNSFMQHVSSYIVLGCLTAILVVILVVKYKKNNKTETPLTKKEDVVVECAPLR